MSTKITLKFTYSAVSNSSLGHPSSFCFYITYVPSRVLRERDAL